MTAAQRVLCAALILMTVLYVAWFWHEPVAMLVFALPSAALAIAALRGAVRAGFWSGVLALAWFSHGVMVAWTRAPERAFALIEVVLAVVVVFAASVPGLRARFAKRS
ncbi:MAG: DUF2069 domain-containing protein [Lysobacter sp.]|nr:DUF2069 domain-containing protein [Lysobacter sp.]